MEVKITRQELIKPSPRTPQHLKTFKLSLLDQLFPFPTNPVLLYFPANAGPDPSLDVRRKLDLLKKSLSQTLARLYPLAGKIRDGLNVECNDEGVRLVEASVNMSLLRFLADPDLVSINKLIPCELSLELTHLANIQVSVFQCGGIALTICNTHKLHDGAAISTFLKEWTSFSRGGGDCISSKAAAQDLGVAAELFPTNDVFLKDLAVSTRSSMCKKGNCATKRFLFSGPAIEALKSRATNSTTEKPSRVEAVSGFLWQCVMTACRTKNNGLTRPSTFTHLVNTRKRIHPPLPETTLGSLLWVAVGHSGTPDSHRADDTLPSLVSEMRRAVSKVDGDFLLGLTRDKNLIRNSLEQISRVGSSDIVDHLACSSWCRSGFYDADFGWGSPIWVGSVGFHGPRFLNLIFLVDTRSGDGIEAWVTLDEREMSLLQEDPELRSFASVNPSPLIISSKL